MIDPAGRTAGRNLTQAGWDQYFRGQPYRKTCPDLSIQVLNQPILETDKSLRVMSVQFPHRGHHALQISGLFFSFPNPHVYIGVANDLVAAKCGTIRHRTGRC